MIVKLSGSASLSGLVGLQCRKCKKPILCRATRVREALRAHVDGCSMYYRWEAEAEKKRIDAEFEEVRPEGVDPSLA